MIDYHLEHIFSYTATSQGTSEVIGPVAQGHGVNAYITGGEVSGPRIRG